MKIKKSDDWARRDDVKKWKEQQQKGCAYFLSGFRKSEDFAIVKSSTEIDSFSIDPVMTGTYIWVVLDRVAQLHGSLKLAQELRDAGLESFAAKYDTVLESLDGKCKSIAERDLDGSIAKLETIMSEVERGTYFVKDK